MIKYTQNKIYLPLYSLTEKTCIVKLFFWHVSFFSESVFLIYRKKKKTDKPM